MTLRTLAARLGATLVLAGGLLVAPATAPAQAGDPQAGGVWRRDGVLRDGCRAYPIRYRVRPGDHDWLLEIFLTGPGGANLGTINRASGMHRTRGRPSFEICSTVTRPGRFRLHGKLTLNDPGGDHTVKWVDPDRFRLRRP